MSKEELPSRLRDLSNGMYGLANDAAYIIRELEEVKAERDQARDDLESHTIADRLVDEENAGLTPRIVTADELEVGMWAAWRHRGKWWVEVIERDYDYSDIDGPLVLLADAPPQESGPVTAEDIRASEPGATFDAENGGFPQVWEWTGSRFDVHDEYSRKLNVGDSKVEAVLEQCGPLTRSTAAPRGTYPKRLTVEDLDAAEIGSVLSGKSRFAQKFTKYATGIWGGDLTGKQYRSRELEGLGHRTLTPPEKPEPASIPCTFILVRDEDETGVSGTGRVAEGVIYSDGHVSLRWVVGEHRSTVAYDSVEAVEAIHGHGGKTRAIPVGREG